MILRLQKKENVLGYGQKQRIQMSRGAGTSSVFKEHLQDFGRSCKAYWELTAIGKTSENDHFVFALIVSEDTVINKLGT